LNGYDACRRMRRLPGGDGLTLIALTGWGHCVRRARRTRTRIPLPARADGSPPAP